MAAGARTLTAQVAVVGAGPAGSAAAYALAREGLDVLLVDRAPTNREKPCGDALTPAAARLVAEMGVDLAHIGGYPCVGARLHGPDSETFDHRWSGGPAWVVRRSVLDATLCGRAEAAGARLVRGLRDTRPIWEGDGCGGLRAESDSGPIEVRAPAVVVATGANRSFLRSRFGQQPVGLALRGYAVQVPDSGGFLEVLLDPLILRGYAWIFPVSAGVANVGVGAWLGGRSTAVVSRDMRAAFDRLLAHPRLDGARLVQAPQGYPLRMDFPHLSSDATNVLVIGEAAGLVDPITGEGIRLALESGKIAAEVLLAARREGKDACTAATTFRRRLRRRYGRYFADARELVSRLAQPQVVDALTIAARTDHRVRRACLLAFADERPRTAIRVLDRVLARRAAPARDAFTLGAYGWLTDDCRAYMLARIAEDAPSPALTALLARGKMLRALLVFVGCRAAGGDPTKVLPAAAGVELVHAASLVHDDIMDQAIRRRGLPALHEIVGVPRAIVCGDYLIAKAFRVLADARAAAPADRVVDALVVGGDSGIRTCAGQFVDVGNWWTDAPDESTYDQVMADKTAAAIAGALLSGARLAGASAATCERLVAYGECAGRAFQIRDDLLELGVGGSDSPFSGREPSLPLVRAFAVGGDRVRLKLRHLLGQPSVDIIALRAELDAVGAIQYAEARASTLAAEAIAIAEPLPHVGDALAAFARLVVNRDI